MSAKLKGLVWFFGIVGIAYVFAAGLPFLAKAVPWPVEKFLGDLVGGGRLAGHVCTSRNPVNDRIFRKLTARIFPSYPSDPDLPITMEIIEGDTVNAFAYIGGRIFVYEGLLAKAESPEELAGVLAHEIAHIEERHIMQGFLARLFTTEAAKLIFSGGTLSPDAVSMFLNMRFSVKQEAAADKAGLERLKRGKINARGFENFFLRMGEGEGFSSMLSDHPSGSERAALAKKYSAYPTEPLLSKEEWAQLKNICKI